VQIGIFGHFSGTNLGEQATLIAVAAGVHEVLPDATVKNFATGRFYRENRAPELTADNYEAGIILDPPSGSMVTPSPTTPVIQPQSRLRATLKRVPGAVQVVRRLTGALTMIGSIADEIRCVWINWRELRGIDLFLIVGSNQCFDFYGGIWNYPFTLLKWSALAKIRGAKLAYVCVGAGPIEAPLSRRLLRRALLLADYRSYRDYVSRAVLSEFEPCFANDPVLPELVFSLPLETAPRNNDGKIVIAINTMPVFDGRYWPAADDSAYSRLVDTYVELIRWIKDAGHDYFFYATSPRDTLVVHDVRERLGEGLEQFTDSEIYPGTVAGLIRRIARADVVVALRYHGIVVPYAMGKPTLALEYWSKTRDLAASMNQLDYFVPREDFLVRGIHYLNPVTTRLDTLIRERVNVARQLASKTDEFRRVLQSQYAELLNGY
jgi:polysaccharide pyruvyl transferase WcaK-like protein